MWLMVKELSGRLNSHFNRGKNDSFALYFAGQLPLQEYFDLIDAHFEVGVISIYNQGFKILSKKENCLQGKCMIFSHCYANFLALLTYL